MSTLTVDHLGKRYGAACALDDVSMVFPAGRITAVLGPSGSGKSTLLMAIAGLVRPDAGLVRLDGTDITGLPADRRGFGLVQQSYALFPHLDVLANAAFGLRCRGVARPERERRSRIALDRLGITHLAARGIRQLSGGEQQRVAIARAIAYDPPILLLDEPLAALDAQLRSGLRAELRRLVTDLGVTTVLVTHDQSEAMELGDQLAILRHGRLVQLGAPSAVYARPADAFVGRFLGAANLIPGTGVNGHAVDTALGRLLVANPPPIGACWAMLRPEDLQVATAADGGFQAQCEQRLHLGDRLRLQVGVAGLRLTVDLPNDYRIEPGESLRLEPKPGRTIAMPRLPDEESPHDQRTTAP